MSVTAGAESKNEDFRWQLGSLGFELSPASDSSLPCSACTITNFRPLKPPGAAVLGYRVADAGSGKGMGVFALKSFEVGELVLTEAPLVIYPRDPGDLDSDAMFDHLFASMNAADQKVVMAMANCKGSDMSPFEGILKTNVLGISLPGGREGVPDGYAGLFPVMGRINHSCCPSVVLRFDWETFALEIRAVRPIASGSEITGSYVQDYGSRAIRQARLQASHNFVCMCTEACGLPPDRSLLSDVRRTRLATWTQDHLTFESWASNMGLPDDLFVRENREAIRLIDLENFQIDSLVFLANLAQGYAALKDPENYKIWAAKARDMAIALLGPQDPAVLAYTKGLEDCTQDKSWGRRGEYREVADLKFERRYGSRLRCVSIMGGYNEGVAGGR
ncbi:hypothetical protein BS47DRAFT_1359331 [Hydnum rufescens UP504]|uniref:SET domain-containing protein n=1 Tax=Hydnum rufescens UP504 TaxID=1448309 RepID=A0A9P6B5A5_9AGAM|nr:hypothetical protein BS47DRAFT_1359331 [Hydnum rufescens UP504]